MIKNIVFDLGNVLLTFKPLQYLKKNYNDDNVIDLLYNEIFKSKEWLDLDRGVITDEQAINKIALRNPGMEFHINEFFENRINMFDKIEGTVQILKSIKNNGYKAYYLTNFHLNSFKTVSDRFEFFKEFESGILSADLKLLKPEAEIFHALIDKCGLIASETAFLDDTEENIIMAQKLDFKVIHFKCPEQATEELRLFGVKL